MELVLEKDPTQNGLYVAYVNDTVMPATAIAAERMLLMWHDSAWFFRLSDQKYRGYVYGWIGPLPVLRLEN